MEIFMSNVPTDLTHHGLRDQLQPFMKKLNILDYEIEKPRKRKHANITFLHGADGESFLAIHGVAEQQIPFPSPNQNGRLTTASNRGPKQSNATGKTPIQPRLRLMGANIFCRVSDRTPSSITLRALRHACEERQLAKEVREVKDHDDPVSFDLKGISCGNYTFHQGRLVFVPESDWNDTGMVAFGKRNVTVELNVQRCQMQIPFATIVELIWSDKGSLTLTLSSAPRIFSDQAPVDELMARLKTGDAGMNDDRNPSRWRVSAIDQKHKEVINYCLVYRLDVVSIEFGTRIRRLQRILKDILTVTRFDLALHCNLEWKCVNNEVRLLKAQLQEFRNLPFDILFLMQALVYNGYFHPSTVRSLASNISLTYDGKSSFGSHKISVDAVKKLFETTNYPSPQVDSSQYQVEEIMKYLVETEKEIRQGLLMRDGLFGPSDSLARIFRLVVTPTRITMHGPEMEAKNRVLRKFPQHQEYFLRVQFCDEDGQCLFFNPKVSHEPIYSRFREVLQSGFNIAGRVFSLLGFSHSSLRAHSAWFMAPFVDHTNFLQTHFSVISSLGEFTDIRSPAKHAARIGQAFSETPYAISLPDNEIRVGIIPDVRSADGSRVFSDGVGQLSKEAMHTIWACIPQSKKAPTCFQIRHAGAKGMLTLDPSLKGRQINLRPSMVKFSSMDVKDLEICNMASQPIPLVLNRQMIKILEDLGVKEEWFLKLQNQEVAYLRGITANTYNISHFLKRQSIGDGMRLAKFFRQTEGIDYRKDRFLRSVVEAVVLRAVRLLKYKARIPVDEGITLFGVMDETGYLEEGELYVTFDTMGGRYHPPPPEGNVIITRSPALHPGDIQIARNVVPPLDHPLKELTNCIVFSQKGTRDLPSQLSGGDLDGDIFHVIWDSGAFPSRDPFKAANYLRVPARDIGRRVTKDDMANFFVDFMKTDHLGVIATRHMILSDQMDEGTLDPKCLKLAELHSTAVDFSKTGIPVEMKQLPWANRFRPDFLAPGPLTHIHDKSVVHLDNLQAPADREDEEDDSPRYEYYKSDKILGKLYRAVDEKKIWYEDIHTVPKGGASFWDEFLVVAQKRCAAVGDINWAQRVPEAHLLRDSYEDALLNIMYEWSEHPTQPLRELEVIVGFIINKTIVASRRQRERSQKLRDEFERISTWISDRMRDPSSLGARTKETDALDLCLACVFMGGRTGDRRAVVRGRIGGADLESFRVVAACALLRELELFEQGVKGGSYVGVKGNVRGG